MSPVIEEYVHLVQWVAVLIDLQSVNGMPLGHARPHFCHECRTVPGRCPDGSRPEQGQALVILVFLLAVLIGLVGLATDGALLYVQQGRLQPVVDAAALAAAGALPDQVAALKAADLYVRLNGLQPGTGVHADVLLSSESETEQVTITLTQTISLGFMRILNFDTAQVRASATASRSPAAVDLVLALDSGTCNKKGSSWRCSEIRSGAQSLAQDVLDRGGRIGIVDLRRTTRLLLSPTSKSEKVRNTLTSWGKGSSPTKDRNAGDAIWAAVDSLDGLSGERPRGVLLLMSGPVNIGRNCCAECKCESDGLAECGKKCSYEQCCAQWALTASSYAWKQGVFVLALDGTGENEGTELLRTMADLTDDKVVNGSDTYYVLVGERVGKGPKKGDYVAAFGEASLRLPGEEGVQLVR